MVVEAVHAVYMKKINLLLVKEEKIHTRGSRHVCVSSPLVVVSFAAPHCYHRWSCWLRDMVVEWWYGGWWLVVYVAADEGNLKFKFF